MRAKDKTMHEFIDLESKILQMGGGEFQRLCDRFLSSKGYENYNDLGMAPGTNKTAPGSPDTWFMHNSSKQYVLVMYTTEQSGDIYKKIFDDVCKCFDEGRTHISDGSLIYKIVYCHTSNRLRPGDHQKIVDLCNSKGVEFECYGIGAIADGIYQHYPWIAKEFFGLEIGTGQVFSAREFKRVYDQNSMAAPISTKFLYREKEMDAIISSMNEKKTIIIYGVPGVGKTKLALEACERYADENNHALLCIKSNGQSVYNDVRLYLNGKGNCIIFVDDANDLVGLGAILTLQQEINQNAQCVLVLTVREYAFTEVHREVLKTNIPEIFHIGPMADEFISQIIQEQYHITNPLFIERILKIAEGNIRLAVLASKLASEENTLESISDASQLYDHYFSTTSAGELLHQYPQLAIVAGVTAFFSTISLDNLDKLSDIFRCVSMDETTFSAIARDLYEQEILDHEAFDHNILKVSDQCFANFLIKYAFFDRKLIPLYIMVKFGFLASSQSAVNACSMMITVFHSESVEKDIYQAVESTWNEFQESGHDMLWKFIKAFHPLRSTETLGLISDYVNQLDAEMFEARQIDFKKGENFQNYNDDYLEILGHYAETEQQEIAIQIFLNYFIKRPKRFMEFFHAANSFWNIRAKSYYSGYITQRVFIEKLISTARESNDENLVLLFIRLAKSFLPLSFSTAETGRKRNTIEIARVCVALNSNVEGYRKAIWDYLAELYSERHFTKELEETFFSYCNNYGDEIDVDVIKCDFSQLVNIFATVSSEKRAALCILASFLFDKFEYILPSLRAELCKYLESVAVQTYYTLKGKRKYEDLDYSEGRIKKRTDIHDFAQGLTLYNYTEILDCLADLSEIKAQLDEWELSEGIVMLFEVLASADRELFIAFLEGYILRKTPFQIVPNTILKLAFQVVPITDLVRIIAASEYDEKNKWVFAMFANWPDELLNGEVLRQWYDFLARPDSKFTSSPYRQLDFLDRYRSWDDDVWEKSFSIIYDHYFESPFVFKLYTELLFSPYAEKFEEIVDRLNRNYVLLSALYLKSIQVSNTTDYEGTILAFLAEKGTGVLDEYIDIIAASQNHDLEPLLHRIGGIWESDQYSELIEHVVKLLSQTETISSYTIFYEAKYLFVHGQNNRLVAERQHGWILEYILKNAQNIENIKWIFLAISSLSFELKRECIIVFTQNNKDFSQFNTIEFDPIMWNVEIPYMEQQRDFWSSLTSQFNTLDYIRHRQLAEDKSRLWQRRIDRENWNRIIREWNQ